LVELPNVHKTEAWFYWNFIKDADDNKFVDIAISAGIIPIISEDSDFNILKTIDFPKIEVWRISQFLKWIDEKG
jgi:uncharacterized protein